MRMAALCQGASAPRLLTLQAEHHARQSQAGERGADQVEMDGAGFFEFLDVALDHDDAEQADGDVDVEDPAPG